MNGLNPAYVKAVAENVNLSPYFALLSMEIKTLGLGTSHLEVLVQEKHLQPFGQVHGGVYSSLVDAAAFWAAYTQIPEDYGMTTVELKLNYLRPISKGRMVALGKSIKSGKTLCLAEASIEDGSGALLAHGVATMMVLKNLKIQGNTVLPPKFLE